ncbi:predicted protein [Sclerotinia sclerotiorum 1980 UF-70]|uniref:Uncharacterized protein n=2 Tax=Sclerotinia sclerotiorum (strain ATCC 18683 / 1980 / Ss-1) TaxID=665079 RepID=A7E7I1_SCLS1|nr:predicted protein [Sclerotinia sclerotiorum 1980 UF-70]APA06248.1 hypothetical protein sscle_01g010180 [Sclerotinia sclerotiorum 1980 UF-70]EDN96333.1 predicted protein [Sclerotinia sclerotiorum 1980 UF-70]
MPNERNLPSKEIQKSKSDPQTILDENKPSSSSSDIIMSDENWNYETQTKDSLMFDGSYATNTQSSTTTSHHPSSKPEHPASSSDKRYVPTPRRYRGILDPRDAAEDAAFFARANRRYRQGIENAFRENERKTGEKIFGSAERKKVVLKDEGSCGFFSCS